MAEILSAVSLISYIAACVFGVAAVALWFLFKVPSVIGDLSGRNAKKSIERMRVNNEKSRPGKNYETGILKENKAKKHQSEETALLVDENATSPLDEGAVTEPLETKGHEAKRKEPSMKIKMIEEVVFLHTEETV